MKRIVKTICLYGMIFILFCLCACQNKAPDADVSVTETSTSVIETSTSVVTSVSVPEQTVSTEEPKQSEPEPEQEPERESEPEPEPEPVVMKDPLEVRKVLAIVFDPVYKGKTMHERGKWDDPQVLAQEFIEEMYTVSHGYANYEVVKWVYVDEMPRATAIENGFQYSVSEYAKLISDSFAWGAKTGNYFAGYSGWKEPVYDNFSFDYKYYLSNTDNVLKMSGTVYEEIDEGLYEEVWVFYPPMIYAYPNETRMIGKDAFFVNGTPMEEDCKPFIVYGFNYERGVDCMLEDVGHRMESILDEVFGRPDYNSDYSKLNDWGKFCAADVDIPGMSGVGWMHYGPNSVEDYDWENETYVFSYCNTWLDFPDRTDEKTKVNCHIWLDDWSYDMPEDGSSVAQLSHHRWWFNSIPHVGWDEKKDGFYTNWWHYFTLDYLGE